eukprot:gnl/TRDRNA2_/TRDRNA2_29273_c0_seq1.p2 gnl/TRDRNA2_/TRDRNA2_29273_c0~~gnl/TRDRNA2_/TRDRNA2_29273_c0_seq1.p2  ORF type:complete len:200 (-),score=68.24 gnl/TRDRNA2_/TRDRNA2_29273_c0_seq1:44-643(-)
MAWASRVMASVSLTLLLLLLDDRHTNSVRCVAALESDQRMESDEFEEEALEEEDGGENLVRGDTEEDFDEEQEIGDLGEEEDEEYDEEEGFEEIEQFDSVEHRDEDDAFVQEHEHGMACMDLAEQIEADHGLFDDKGMEDSVRQKIANTLAKGAADIYGKNNDGFHKAVYSSLKQIVEEDRTMGAHGVCRHLLEWHDEL